MALRVGSAFADFDLSLDPFRRSVELVKAEIGALQRAVATASTGSAVAGSRVSPGEAAAAKLTRDEVLLAQALARTAAAEARKAAEANKAAVADNRAAESAAKVALNEQRKATELARTAKAQDQAAVAALRRAQAEDKAAKPLPRTFAGFTAGGLAQALGAFGIATIGPQLVGSAISGGVGAAQNAIALQQTRGVLRQLSGDQERYNTLVKIAGENQRLFGGSLLDNLSPLSSVLALANQTGASIEQLNSASQLLLAKAPTKNAGDAFFGLGEFLSGNGAEAALSLADQFNLPKAALAELAKEGTTASERLSGLTKLLAEQGVTAETLNARLTDQAKAYNALNAELDTLQTNAGAGLATAFEGAATGLGRLIGLINNNPEAIAQIRAILGGRNTVTQEDVAQVGIDQATELVDKAITDAGRRRAFRLVNQNNALPSVLNVAVSETQLDRSNEALADMRQRLIDLAVASPEAGQQISAFLGEFSRTGNVDVLRAGIEALERQQQGLNTSLPPYVALRQNVAAADEAGAAATAKEGSAIAESIQKRQQAQQLQERQAQVSAAVEEATLRVARGESTQAEEVARLSAVYPGLAAQFDGLITGQLQLESATDAATAALGRQRIEAQKQTPGAVDNSGSIGFNSPGRQGTSDVNAVVRAIEAEREAAATAAQRAEDAREAATLRNGTQLQKQEILQKRVNEAVRQFGKDSAEAISAQADLDALRERGGRRTVDQTASTLGRIEDRTEDHYRRLMQLQEDYQTRASRAQEDFETKRTRDQEDFDRRRQKLLAEGKIKEAELLTEEFTREQKRAREDFDRQQARATEDLATQQQRQAADVGIDTGRIVDRAALRGVRVGSALPQVQTPPVPSDIVPLDQPRPTGLAPQPAALPPIVIQIQERTVQVVMPDGRVIAEATLPFIEQRLAEDLATGQIAVPVGANVAGGPRP